MRANHTLLGVSSGLAAILLVSAAPTPSEEPASSPQQPAVEALVREWRANHGQAWREKTSSETGHVNFLYGGSARPATRAQSDAEYFQLARDFFAEAQGLFGIEADTLVEDHVMLLPLALAGTTDKVSVQFRQAVDGVPVERGFVNALFHVGGELLALDTTGFPGISDLDVTPTVSAEDATDFAVNRFAAATGTFATSFTVPALTIVGDRAEKLVRPTLAWKVTVLNETPGQAPEGTKFFVAAQGTPEVVASEDAIHYFDVGGTVMANVTPGTKPDTASNPEVMAPAAYMRVTAGGNTTFTDVNGDFNFAGLNGPINVTFRFDGSFNNVQNNAGSNHTRTLSLSGTGNGVLMNNAPTQTTTSEANAFHHVNLMRDWTRGLNPADANMDFVNTANVMLNSTCNAFYNGSSTNYFNAGGGCPNTAYSTVIQHEQGHWQNDRYGSGNGSDGFGEGNADVFAMYQVDSPIVGEDFLGAGSNIRTGLNTRQWCGPGCYGEVHADGEVWMGVAWKIRRNLKNTTPGGGAIADQIFSAWMNGFNQGSINPIIEDQWLTLDDDDGDINNGTPHYTEIDDGFTAQGFPGFALSFVSFANTIEPADTLDDVGPYGIAADLSPVFGSAVTAAEVQYSVDGGPFQVAPMTNVVGTTYTALLPGLPSPASVSWYISASDDLGNTDTFPKNAPSSVNSFRIGEITSFFFDDFEVAGTGGWTHGLFTNQDDWQKGTPNGSAGDATSAFSGTQIWGNDLAPSGWNGSYMPNTHNWLRSPSIDLSSATGSTLSIQRWLTVEEGIFDQATIWVNGTQAWANPLNGNLIDTAWTNFQLDISALADGVANTRVEFRLQSDGGLEFGGWNIDDFEILNFGPTPTACRPTVYGTGLAGANGVPLIDSAGQPTRIGNADNVIKVKNGPPLATAFLGIGPAPVNVPIFGGSLLVAPSLIQVVNLDVFGQFELAAPLANDPGSVGQNFFLQAFVLDPAAPMGVSMTEGLAVTICN